MRINILTPIVAAFLAISSYAGDFSYSPFASVEVGTSKASFKDGTLSALDYSSQLSAGIKVGIRDSKSRVYAALHYYKSDADYKIDANNYIDSKSDRYDLLACMEGLSEPFMLTKSLSSIFFIGGHFGGAAATYDNTVVVGGSGVSKSDTEFGLAYGAQGGLILEFANRVGLEFGYRYTMTTVKIEESELEYYHTVYGAL
ncbi:MAG: hypothetical protein L3J42_03950, partial [Hydrogenimonas sp.]|nr:hypothetical protein [Hydrogenimonas sp.]